MPSHQLGFTFLFVLSLTTLGDFSSPNCPLPIKKVKPSNSSCVHLFVHFCIQVNSTSKNDCIGDPLLNVSLRKGKTVKMENNITHDLTTKFFGDEVCVSYRKLLIYKGIGNRVATTSDCEFICFEEEGMATVGINVRCFPKKCSHGREKLKFVVNRDSKPSTCPSSSAHHGFSNLSWPKITFVVTYVVGYLFIINGLAT